MSGEPPGFSVRRELADIIYRLDPEEAPLVAASARIGAKQVLDELAQSDPVFAAERRKHERELKAWRRKRKRLGEEIVQLQTPFIVAVLGGSAAAGEILRVSRWLFENDAPGELILGLLGASAKEWLAP